ncbi:MAG: beta-ketoacyl synthase N-terminal-like domain-containing protein [Polyangiaceae bacterium]
MQRDREQSHEPIAIVGIGCRFPGGAHDVDAYWRMLAAGVDAIREVPSDRFSVERFYHADSERAGKMRSRWGGFVEQPVELFDALFFGMSPREAEYLDPMQRWLLEVSWEALENAGIVPAELSGSDTAVYIGGFTEDIKLLQMAPSNRELLGPHAATGSAMTMLANRLSYFYDLRGPSLALDTACSSSLVAVHLACQSLLNGESQLAFAGGVNAMFRPEYTIAESKAGMLSPDGRSKAFDSRANGYVRGEGAGIVLLESLSRALALGHPIHALIRGTAVNQDGRTPGITVPSGHAQQALIEAACARAGVSPAEIQYVEAHGTGTPVGDPIEVNALGAALGKGRERGAACWIGSVKTNMGHLEAAAGVAGLIKAALCLRHAAIPPHLHLQRPNPQIDFERLGLRVPLELTPWPSSERRLASVNSFGFGGTNAHVVLEAAPPRVSTPRTLDAPAATLFTLSAQSEGALRALAQAHQQRLTAAEVGPSGLADLAHSMNQHRAQHELRLSLRADSQPSLIQRLGAFLAGETSAGVVSGRRRNAASGPVFVFAGMGPQWWGMGQGLLEREPLFRSAVEECDALFRPLAGWSLLEEMTRDEPSSRMARTEVAQPASFALQLGLARWWRARGVEPAAIVGHSAGEVAAAYVAGVYDLADAVTVIYHRSRLQQRCTGQGRLVALGVSHVEAQQAIAEHAGRISIAAVNGPRSVTLVGDEASLTEFLRPFEAREVFVRRLQVDVPYHSHYMDPLRDELLACLARIRPEKTKIPLFSTVRGERSLGSEWDANYWWHNVRDSVLFARAMQALGQAGYDTFIELGAHPVLTSSIGECLTELGKKTVVVASLRRKSDEPESLLDALAALYVDGHEPDLGSLSSPDARFIELPLYPFQRDPLWAESDASRNDRVGVGLHPLLGQRAEAARPRFVNEIDAHRPAYLADHVVRGNVVFPGAGYVEAMLAAARTVEAAAASFELSGVHFHKALFLSATRSAQFETAFDAEQGRIAIFIRDSASAQWVEHASGRVRARARLRALGDAVAWRAPAGSRRVEVADCYAYLQRLGLEYGPRFRGIRELWLSERSAEACVELDDAAERDYLLHPALLDACFQAMLVACADFDAETEPRVYLPVEIESLRLHAHAPRRLWLRTEIESYDARELCGNLRAYDEHGQLVLELRRVRARSVENLQASGPSLSDLFYEVEWRSQPLQPNSVPAEAGAWLVLDDGHPLADAIVVELERRQQRSVRVGFAEDYVFDQRSRRFLLNPRRPEHFGWLLEAIAGEQLRGALQLGSLSVEATAVSLREHVERAEAHGPITLLHLLQALEKRGTALKLYAVTRGAQSIDERDPTDLPLGAAVWGSCAASPIRSTRICSAACSTCLPSRARQT